MNERILKGVERYYTAKVMEHGPTAQGVDWNSKDSQYLRFAQLCKLLPEEGPLRLLDHGCGYGELLNHLGERYPGRALEYHGHDISAEMVAQALALSVGHPHVTFSTAPVATGAADHVIASGLFNVRLDLASDDEWYAYIVGTLRELHRESVKGFAFNALTSYSDPERMKNTLYYADPCRLFDLCKREFSRDVALLHDYGLYEFTILVRK